ncbi:hypothetical protein ACOMHN_019021 [Nucella lapillus]
MDKVVFSTAILVAMLFTVAETCTIPSKIWGSWDVMDATRTQVEFSVTITDTSLNGITFWNKTLDYDCFLTGTNYYVFKSVDTTLFDIYDVNIYFCWYLQAYTATTYRVYELTGKVLYSTEERAKAYMNNGTVPTINEICEVAFESALVYKQMQVPFNP